MKEFLDDLIIKYKIPAIKELQQKLTEKDYKILLLEKEILLVKKDMELKDKDYEIIKLKYLNCKYIQDQKIKDIQIDNDNDKKNKEENIKLNLNCQNNIKNTKLDDNKEKTNKTESERKRILAKKRKLRESIYVCECCNFNTKRSDGLKNHFETKAHKMKSGLI